MDIRQIRNATIIVTYGGKLFLIDPVFAPQGVYPPFPDSPRQHLRNPLVELPVNPDELLPVDAVIVTHLHSDHFDEAAADCLPKDIKLFVQNGTDQAVLLAAGFKNLEILTASSCFEGIQLVKTAGQHGRGLILEQMGDVCGIVFKHPEEKTLYVAGDTVWYPGVGEILKQWQPEVIILNAGGNYLYSGGPLVMGKEDLFEVCRAAPAATVIASHMEAMNHWGLSRNELKAFLSERHLLNSVLVPEDGESYRFSY